MPKDTFLDRPWTQSDNPKTAVWEYLQKRSDFEVDKLLEDKLMISVAPNGYLKKIA